MVNVINDQDVVGSVIAINKKRDLSALQNILPENIIKKVLRISIPINDVEDKIIWKYTTDSESLLKVLLGLIIIMFILILKQNYLVYLES